MVQQELIQLELFQQARRDEILSDSALEVLSRRRVQRDVKRALAHRGLLPHLSNFVVSLLVDDSFSIFKSGFVKAMCDGHNAFLRRMRELPPGLKTPPVVYSRYINGEVINEFVPAKKAQLLGSGNYTALGGTPLYRETLGTLGAVVAKVAQLHSLGVTAHSFTLILTDAEEEQNDTNPADVAKVVRSMIGTTEHHVAGIGFGDRHYYEPIFRSMGIPPQWIRASGDVSDLGFFFEEMSAAAQQLMLAAGRRT